MLLLNPVLSYKCRPDKHFNTSYVVIKQRKKARKELLNSNFNTSYVVIKHKEGSDSLTYGQISIHLMLLLNIMEKTGQLTV